MENNNIEQTKQNSNFVIYILLFCIVFLIGIIGVIFMQYEILSQDELKDKYIKKSDISFETLPPYIQEQYIEKYRCNKNDTKSVEIKTVEVIKEVSEDIFAKEKYHVAKCYDMKIGTPWLSKKCESDIKKFILEHKDAKFFEVIGVVSKKDFLVLNRLKANQDVLKKLNVTDEKISKLEKYMVVGLSKKRVEETSWFIKKTLGIDTKVLPVNYNIISKKNNRGTVVRVYYYYSPNKIQWISSSITYLLMFKKVGNFFFIVHYTIHIGKSLPKNYSTPKVKTKIEIF